MRTFAQKPRIASHSRLAKSAKMGSLSPAPIRNIDTLIDLQRTIGNHAFYSMLQDRADRLETVSKSRTPIESTSSIAEQESGSIPATLGRRYKKVKQHGDDQRNRTKNMTGMPDELKAGLEILSGFDLSDVRVQRNSPKPESMNALAYTRGNTIHLAPNQEKHLPHEGWHVVQQTQGRVKAGQPQSHQTLINTDPRLEAEAVRMGRRAANPAIAARQTLQSLTRPRFGDASKKPVQRQVRINGGQQRVNEADYLPGGSKSGIGSRYSVAALIQDNVRRVFSSVAELEGYSNGQTDYIGDVQTASTPDPFWYRLPENDLTVLGEIHHNPDGNVEDAILGLQTSRFMYEPFHEFTDVAPFNAFQIGGGTQARLGQIESGLRSSSQVDRTNFDPHLENIVIKAITGATVARNEFIAANPATMGPIARQTWGSRPTTADYSFGERIALYFSMAIHIAQDLAQYTFAQQSISHYIDSTRILAEFYLANQAVLDNFMMAKDADDLIGIYDITAANNFADLPVLNEFSLRFHEYGSRYIEQLGVQMANPALEAEGRALSGNLAATLQTFSPAREEIMWERVMYANTNDYLIAGMGDLHRQNFQPRLNAAGIRNEEVAQGLRTQQTAINNGWRP